MKKQDQHVIHLAIADDHELFRSGISALISSFDGFKMDIEVSDGEELIKQLKKAKRLPEICLLDINMPRKNGYDTLKEIKAQWPDMKFLVLTMFNTEYAIMRMLRGGANGYTLKNCNPNELKKALTAIYETGYYHSELVSNRIHTSLKNEDKITDKEIQFLTLCCNDCSYREIAEIMHVSPRTVEGYRDALFQKLNIKTRTGLVMYAISTGIVPFSET